METYLKRFLCSALALFYASMLQANSKAEAVIINAAIGDALGRVTEFIDTTNEIHHQFGPQGVTSLSQAIMLHPTNGQPIAPYTDDTVMSLIVLKALLTFRNQHQTIFTFLHSLACSFAQLLGNSKFIIDPLYTLRAHGLRNIQAGAFLEELIQQDQNHVENWWLTKKSQNAIALEGGCGSVMRAWPIGLVCANKDPQLIILLAKNQSELTHQHPMALAASAAIASGVACAYNNKSVDEVVQAMIHAAEAFDKEELVYKKNAKKMSPTAPLTATMIAQDKLLTSDMIRYAYQAARYGKTPEQVLGTHNSKQANYRSTEGFLLGWAADEAVAAAVYLFTRNSENPTHAIIEGVNTPGDSDSIASLAGALVGARTGKIFEDSHRNVLENNDYLNALAQQV